MTEVLSIAVRLQDGTVDTARYWTSGRWAQDKNWLWDYAVREALAKAKELGVSKINICYNDGEVLGGVVLN